MPTWNDILSEIQQAGSTHDLVRRRYLKKLATKTKRNVIIYYSGWLQKSDLYRQQTWEFTLNDADKNGLMATIYEMPRDKGLDLVLHPPGGDMAATESLIDYLRQMFGGDIRAIVPQIAMSGGTMIALACKQIIMGKHSNLGPIDPQFSGIAAHAVKEEFERAVREVQIAPHTAAIWQVVLSKYGPSLISESTKAIKWADDMTKEWLITGMFKNDTDAVAKADRVVRELGDHAITMSHARHISLKAAQNLGLDVVPLEDDQALQDSVLSVHHAAILTMRMTPAVKLIENDRGVAFVQQIQQCLSVLASGDCICYPKQPCPKNAMTTSYTLIWASPKRWSDSRASIPTRCTPTYARQKSENRRAAKSTNRPATLLVKTWSDYATDGNRTTVELRRPGSRRQCPRTCWSLPSRTR
jgi:ATP-dependent protease ClpP protease subunit